MRKKIERGQASQESIQNPNQNSIEEFLEEVGRVGKGKEIGECSKHKELEWKGAEKETIYEGEERAPLA